MIHVPRQLTIKISRYKVKLCSGIKNAYVLFGKHRRITTTDRLCGGEGVSPGTFNPLVAAPGFITVQPAAPLQAGRNFNTSRRAQ